MRTAGIKQGQHLQKLYSKKFVLKRFLKGDKLLTSCKANSNKHHTMGGADENTTIFG